MAWRWDTSQPLALRKARAVLSPGERGRGRGCGLITGSRDRFRVIALLPGGAGCVDVEAGD